MAFTSVNEIELFSFADCQLVSMKMEKDKVVLEANSVIVRARNSQNSHFTDSYADTLTMTLEGAVIEKAAVEGYKRFNADDVLIEEVQDRPLSEEELQGLAEGCRGFYLFAFDLLEKRGDRSLYVLEIEDPGEDGYDVMESVTYELKISFSRAVFSWDRFLNHVER